jgi:hypothetical protein
MASIGPVTLSIFDRPQLGDVLIQVSYEVQATDADVSGEQEYREVVELIGVDTLPGEDGVDEPIAGGTLWDGIRVFDGLHVGSSETREKTLPPQALDEDPSPIFPKVDEIRARVTLTPVLRVVSRESNLVRRGELVIGPA